MNGTILIVDDQIGIRFLLREVFAAEGFAVHEAADGLELKRTIDVVCPDLVLLDMKLPGANGLELLREIKWRERGINVILMTAYEELSLVSEAKSLGVLCHFAKPFDVYELLDYVKTWFAGVNKQDV